jgi:hypothetical protein
MKLWTTIQSDGMASNSECWIWRMTCFGNKLHVPTKIWVKTRNQVLVWELRTFEWVYLLKSCIVGKLPILAQFVYRVICIWEMPPFVVRTVCPYFSYANYPWSYEIRPTFSMEIVWLGARLLISSTVSARDTEQFKASSTVFYWGMCRKYGIDPSPTVI